jgi:hypothetical protein
VGREERRLLGCGDDEAAPPLYIYTSQEEDWRGEQREGATNGGKQRRKEARGLGACWDD